MSGISNHFDAMVAIQGILQALTLPGLNTFLIQEVPIYQDSQLPLPYVSISPFGPESTEDVTNGIDGVNYGIAICIVASQNLTDLEQRLAWRQKMRSNLNNRSIANFMNYNLKVEMKNVVEVQAILGNNRFVSGFVVRAYFEEPRLQT